MTFLFIVQRTENINRDFGNVNVKIDGIVLLDDAGRRNLREFGTSGIDRIDYDAYLAEV